MTHLLLRFCDAMYSKLLENNHKSGWEGLTFKWLLNRLRQETAELEGATLDFQHSPTEKHLQAVQREAADVANFAMMIYDNAQNTSQEDKQ